MLIDFMGGVVVCMGKSCCLLLSSWIELGFELLRVGMGDGNDADGMG